MTIEKLPSGSYRIRQTINGKRYSVTVPYKPGKKEAFQLIQNKIDGSDILRKTFKECAVEYITGKEHTLSPSTIRSYESMLKQIPEDILNAEIGTITAWDIQIYMDQLTAEGKTPKTVRNYHGFISAIFSVFSPSVNLSTQLPQKVQAESHAPTDEEIKQILNVAKGTAYEVPLRLACYGLRRSEVCALTEADLKGNQLTINKALVRANDGKWVIKTTKTTSSTRTIMIDDDLAGLIREKGFFTGYPDAIYQFLQSTQKKLGIPKFPLHYFRHYYVSTMHELGVPDEDIMASGGWKTDHVMKRVYRHSKNSNPTQKMIEHMATMK